MRWRGPRRRRRQRPRARAGRDLPGDAVVGHRHHRPLRGGPAHAAGRDSSRPRARARSFRARISSRSLGPMASLQLTRLPLSRLERLEKRVFDLLVASLALILLTPHSWSSAVLIKLDSPGPVFFLQRRYGFNQKPFRIIKFRTMRTLDDGPGGPTGAQGRPARHQGRGLAAPLEHRRAAAAVQRPHGRHVAGRPAAARALAQSRVRAAHLALCAPAQRQAGHHRLGADPRLPRRDRHRRQDAADASSTTSTTSTTGRSGSISRS